MELSGFVISFQLLSYLGHAQDHDDYARLDARQGDRLPDPVWVRFHGSGGRDVVAKEIDKCFKNDKRGRAQLLDLMKRVREGRTLAREVEDLGGGLLEAKLTYQGQEFRLFFSRQRCGFVLLALHVVNKKAPRIPHDIELARTRLAEWLAR